MQSINFHGKITKRRLEKCEDICRTWCDLQYRYAEILNNRNTYKEFMNLNLFSFPAGWNARWELVAAFRENYVLPDVCNDMVRILQETVASMPEIFE